MAKTTRRMILKTGAAAVVVTAAAGAWWGSTRTPTKALAPWENASKGYGDPRLDALAYAILAPNPHNRQPWRIELVGNDAMDLRCDPDRRLPNTDPFDRQITIGMGCFLELLRMAAATGGYDAQISPFPDGVPQPRLDNKRIARVTFKKSDVKRDPLFDAVFERRSVKEPFDTTRDVPTAMYQQLLMNSRVSGTLDKEVVKGFRELTDKAHHLESYLPRTLKESVDLMRFGKAEVEANPDGIDFSGPIFEAMNKTGIMTRENVGDPNSAAFKQGLSIYEKIHFTAMGYIWVTTPDNSRESQLIAGYDWVRANLQATKLGISLHPLSMILQEYSEMAEMHKAFNKAVGVMEPNRVQMFGRIGYGPKVGKSPRWPMETILETA